jgi:iron-sulfur cluster repair protein YtfE (RIC family)
MTMMAAQGFDRVREEHGELRVMLGALDEAAARVLAHTPGALSELRAAVRALDVSFRAHLVMEETALVPVLSAEAVERLRRDHGEQRAALVAISSEVEADLKEPARLADDARWLVRGLLRDMQEEDSALSELAAREGEG